MLIVNGTLITWENPNRILDHGAILVQEERIVEIGPENELKQKFPNEEILDARGQFVMPGNICAHTHFYGAFSRGLNIPGTAAKDFPEILQKLWWPLDKSLTAPDVKYSALVCLIDAIKHGTTILVDHHASPNAIDGSLDQIAEAVDTAGVRASLCYEVTDRDGREKSLKGIAENIRFIEFISKNQQYANKISAMFGLHASLTLGDETLRMARDRTPDGIGFHVHVAEHSVDEYDSLAKSGNRVVDRLEKFGILGPKTLAVHAVHVDSREIRLLSDTGTWVAHQPRSNMNNGVGVSDVESMMRSGIKVCLGNDGFSNTMWEEWKVAYLVHKLKNLDPRRMSGTDIVKIAVYNNSMLAEALFPGKTIGAIKLGAQADLIFVDYKPFTILTPDNLPWHILFGFFESMVTTTIVAGKVLMYNRELKTLDEEKISAEAMKLSQDVWKRYQNQF
jgi:putative selenium metabolism protein SsnA